jgi:hypothetical protein
LAGLLGAGLAYFAANAGYFDGPVWLAALTATGIGMVSGATLVALDRALRRRLHDRPARPTGPWACPRCGAAYVPEATICSDCHVPLVKSGR